MAAVKETAPVTEAEPMVNIFLPLLEEESSDKIDQTVPVARNGKTLVIRRGVHVDVPVWAYLLLKESGRFDGV